VKERVRRREEVMKEREVEDIRKNLKKKKK